MIRGTKKIMSVLGTTLLMFMFFGCQTTKDGMVKVNKDRGELTFYSAGDDRTATPDPRTYVPLKETEKVLNQNLAKNGNDITSLLGLAQVAIIQDKLDVAENYCKAALRKDLKNPEAKKTLAEIALRRGNPTLASIILNGVGGVESKDSQVLNMLAIVEYEKGNNAASYALFQKALEMNANDIAVRMNLGVLHLKYRQLQAAAVQFERVLKTVPGQKDAELHLAIIKAARGQISEAENIYDRILSEKKFNPLALYNYAVLQAKSTRYHDALEVIKTYLSTKPTAAEANEAFALIDEIQRQQAARGEKIKISDDEIKSLAAKVQKQNDEKERQKVASKTAAEQPKTPKASTASTTTTSSSSAKATKKTESKPQPTPKKKKAASDDSIEALERELIQ